ncbi:mobilome CxxCx(11)CxxC protein [Stenotrophomonas sp. S4]
MRNLTIDGRALRLDPSVAHTLCYAYLQRFYVSSCDKDSPHLRSNQIMEIPTPGALKMGRKVGLMDPPMGSLNREGTVRMAANQRAQQCWDRACDCFATAKIFERRARAYRSKLDLLSYLGIGVPAVFGAMVAAWGKDVLTNRPLMFLVASLGVVQVAISVASIIRKWPEEYAYANRSAATNYQLADAFKTLAPNVIIASPEMNNELQNLIARDQAQTQNDTEKHVSESEKSWGHRHALRQFQRSCANCNTVPTDIKPSSCSQCGAFK